MKNQIIPTPYFEQSITLSQMFFSQDVASVLLQATHREFIDNVDKLGAVIYEDGEKNLRSALMQNGEDKFVLREFTEGKDFRNGLLIDTKNWIMLKASFPNSLEVLPVDKETVKRFKEWFGVTIRKNKRPSLMPKF